MRSTGPIAVAAQAAPLLRRVSGLVVPLACAGIVMAAALWAFAPLHRPDITPVDTPSTKPMQPGASMLVALDRSAFRAPLWIAPPPPPPPQAPAAALAPPPPLKLQLLAIVKEDGEGAATSYKAMVYDPDSDKVLIVAAGEKLGERLIESIDQTALRIKDARGGGTRVLALKSEGGGK